MTTKNKKEIYDLYNSVNIAEDLDESTRRKITDLVIDEFEEDKSSCGEIEEITKLAMDIAMQVMEDRTTPWPGASSVKYPLITGAAIQSAARMYPEVIRNGRAAEAKALGPDPDGEKEQQAKRVSEHLNYQLLIESDEWEPDTDRLLHVLPIVGTVFKKTFWDECLKTIRSIMCAPNEIVVNRNIKSIETARRVTHIMHLPFNDIVSRVRYGLFYDCLDKILPPDTTDTDKNKFMLDGQKDPETGDKDLQVILEQHRYLDLDHDGYEEPYVVTVHKDSRQLLRIYRRFDLQNIHINPTTGQIWKIDPCNYFTDYHYIPSPNGSFYSIGFGQILYPLNEAINTLINQLLDAGTLSNRQSGFIGKGFKTKAGSRFLTPGEWQPVDSTGDDIKKNIFPMPVNEPSGVLFQLLGLMIQAGKELTSSTDILQGQQPAQNAPATTVLSLIEQGLKVHSAILKRFFRSEGKELTKIVRLNGIYLEDTYEYEKVLETGVIFRTDYDPKILSIVPVSDPSMGSDAQRLARANALLQLMPMLQGSGQQAALSIYLDSLQMPLGEIKAIIPAPNPNQPSPQQQEVAMKQQKQQSDQNDMQLKSQLKAAELSIKAEQTKINQLEVQLQMAEAHAKAAKMASDAQLEQQKLALQAQAMAHQQAIDSTNTMLKAQDIQNKHIVAMKLPTPPTPPDSDNSSS